MAGQIMPGPPLVLGQRQVGWGAVLHLLLGERGVLRDLVISTAMLAALALAPILLAWLLLSLTIGDRAASTLLFLTSCFIVLVLFEAAFAAARRRLLARLANGLDRELGSAILERVLRLPVTTFDRTSAGTLAHRIDNVARIRTALAGPVAGLALDACVAVLALPLMVSISIVLTVAALALGAVMAGLTLLLAPRNRRAAVALAAAEEATSAALAQTVMGFETVKTLGLERARRERWDVLVAREARHRLAAADAVNQLQACAHLIERGIVYGTILLGAALTMTGSLQLTRPALFAFLLVAARASAPLRDLAGLVRQIDAARAAMMTLAQLADAPPERAATHRGASLEVRGEVRFADVSFAYPGATAPALRQVTFDVAAGSIVGIVGRNGAGKSTVARLLQGLHPDVQGLIKLDGVDLRAYGRDDLRGVVALVGSDGHLFHGTVGSTIAAARPVCDAEAIVHAARLVGAEEQIAALPHGYDTELSEGAAELSEGLRQRLAIARALAADPAILILDEATSALDPESNALLTANLRRIAAGRTVIVISQRLTALSQADTILVLDRGEVQNIGRHRDLLERCVVYRGLWQRQTMRSGLSPQGERPPRAAQVA